MAGLKKQLQSLDTQKQLSQEKRQEQALHWKPNLGEAQRQYVAAYADIRNASPAYRLAVGQDLKPAPLARLQRWAAEQDALVLEYLLGFEAGYVLVLPGKGQARVERIAVTPRDRGRTRHRTGAADRRTSLEGAQQLPRHRFAPAAAQADTPEKTREAVTTLAALWQVLMPQSEQSAITSREIPTAGDYARQFSGAASV